MADIIKTVRIACEGAGVVPIDEFTIFQGNLKTLSDEGYSRLRMSILELGVSFPVNAWRSEGKKFVLDATQRITTLKRMRDEEGYTIPPLPVVWVEASSDKEASRKLLAAASQYGEVTPDGLHTFMQRFDIDITTMVGSFQFPEIELEAFKDTYFPDPVDVNFQAKPGSKELDESAFSDFDHNCPKCGFGFN